MSQLLLPQKRKKNMIKLYCKEYHYRIKGVIAAIIVAVIAVIAVCQISKNSLDFCAAEIESLSNSSFQYGYVLNYRSGLQNEYIFPNSDILLYTDKDKNHRIAASTAMEISDHEYTKSSLIFSSNPISLQQNDISVSQNIADDYGIAVGDVLYAEMPFSTELQPVVVKAVTQSDYGIDRPNENARLGIVLFGYIPEYENNVRSKYVVFSGESLAEQLAVFPQIVSSTFSRSSIMKEVQTAVIPFVLWFALTVLVVVLVQWFCIFRQSMKSLAIRRRKGMTIWQITIVYITEMLLWFAVPIIGSCIVMGRHIGAVSVEKQMLLLGITAALVGCTVLVVIPKIIRR